LTTCLKLHLVYVCLAEIVKIGWQ